MNLTKKYVSLLTLALFLPLHASACEGGSGSGIFLIILPIVIIAFLYVNRKYFQLIIKSKKLLALTFMPLIIIAVLMIYKMEVAKKEAEIENQKIIECRLAQDEERKQQNINENGQDRFIGRPCGVPTDIRNSVLDITNFALNYLFIYGVFMLLYGIYAIKKKNDIGRKILKFSISLLLVVIITYVAVAMMSTVLLC